MKKGRNIKPDNRGAAMITVVIAILFIVALGVALLSVSYLGYAVTLSQKTGKDNFYDVEQALDDIRAGVHDDASDALANAYTETLKNHASKLKSDPAYDPQKAFSDSFVAELKKMPLMQKNGNDTYSAKALYNMITLPANCTVIVLGYSGGDSESDRPGIVSVQTGKDGKGAEVFTALTLKDIAVTCKNAKNYKMTVTSDITIKVPDFTVAASVPRSLKEFSVVANTTLEKSAGGSSIIAGNVYAGAVNIDKGGNQLTFINGDLLTGGDITVSDSAKFSFGNTKESALSTRELWARSIKLNGSSSVFKTCGGKTYVANDLSVTGAGCTVTLAGEYTGFGGDTAGTANANKDNSSSILIGGKSTSLHMENLNKLTLAGVSFIDVTGQENNNAAIPMGQSIAVKSDQLAYLAPAGCLGSGYPTNPYAYAGDAAPALTVYADTPLWPNTKMTNAKGEALNTKTIVDYLGNPITKGSVSFEKGEVSVRYSQSHIAYVFLSFKDQSAANIYFRDYCAANPENISQYFKYYLSGDLNPGGKVVSAGNTYSFNGTLKQNDASAGVSAKGPADLYKDKSVSPYSSFVKNEPAIKDTYQFKSGGNVVAIVTNVNYTYDSQSPANLQLIVSTGDVTISKDFSGVVIAKGTVTVNGSIGTKEGETWVPPSIDWQTLLNSSTADGKKLSAFLGNGSASTGSGTNKWDIGDLVVYENWQKN